MSKYRVLGTGNFNPKVNGRLTELFVSDEIVQSVSDQLVGKPLLDGHYGKQIGIITKSYVKYVDGNLQTFIVTDRDFSQDFKVCSIEGEVQNLNGSITKIDIKGLALGREGEKTGYSEAKLVAMQGDFMTKKEIKDRIIVDDISIMDLFSIKQILGDDRISKEIDSLTDIKLKEKSIELEKVKRELSNYRIVDDKNGGKDFLQELLKNEPDKRKSFIELAYEKSNLNSYSEDDINELVRVQRKEFKDMSSIFNSKIEIEEEIEEVEELEDSLI